jgi:preprotein translocase subunit SecE
VSDTVAERPQGGSADERPGLGARIALFYRQVVAELRKVIWPTRKELITYTWVVLVFVTMIAIIVAAFDYGFGRLVLWLFGSQ